MHLQLRNRVMAAIRAFQEPHIVMNLDDLTEFDDFDSRLMRYNIMWAFYENTAYSNVHKWATQYRVSQGLYRYIRNIGNPANRLGNFHQTHIWGGMLDPDAGDGVIEPSALPIITDHEILRPIISQIWQLSNWQTKKDLTTLYGATMGDSAIRIVDRPELERVYLEIIHPTLLKEVIKDDFGNVKAYILEEERPDPRRANNKVTYTEIAARDESGLVVFQTYLDNALYAWNGEVAEWTQDYGFIPFVHIPHIDVGSKFGWSELHAGRGKFQEIDDLWSKVDDYIRKITEGLFLFTGTKKPATTGNATTTQTPSSRDRPMPGREDMPGLWGGKDASAIPLIHQANINDMLADIEAIRLEIERDYPELMIDESKEVTAESGRAKRIKQEKPASKIAARRPMYDNALVRAQQMAMSIGGQGGYPGFEGITIDSFERGDLDHHIGQRPVFKVDKIDELEESNLFWNTAAIATSIQGIELSTYLRSQGWTDEQIRDTLRDAQRAESLAARRNARQPVEVQPVNEETSGDIVEDAQENVE